MHFIPIPFASGHLNIFRRVCLSVAECLDSDGVFMDLQLIKVELEEVIRDVSARADYELKTPQAAPSLDP